MVIKYTITTLTTLLTLFTSLPLLFLSLSLSSPAAASETLTDFVFGGCTQQKYSLDDTAYAANVDSLLTSLVNSATYAGYNNFTVTSFGGAAVSGLFQCRGDLNMPDCATCVARAVSKLAALCSHQTTCGAAVQLQGCYIKYDNATFVGVQDETVVMKKCGPSVGYNDEGFARRDAVMAALAGPGGGGGYRVGGAGEVRGVAQCVGDLSELECRDCLTESVGRLKRDCGQAEYGDMFLAKCYARYNTGGSHFNTNPHDDHEKSSDEGEKTFAVIIGLLAGVALIIIFLAFLRKICHGNGK